MFGGIGFLLKSARRRQAERTEAGGTAEEAQDEPVIVQAPAT
jgi:hypothetical protein